VRLGILEGRASEEPTIADATVHSQLPKSQAMTPDYPDWAMVELDKMGITDVSDFQDILYGPIADRKAGLRRDDLVEILLDARSINLLEIDPWIRGRLISSHKSSLEIIDSEGRFRALAREVIVEIRLITHTRPPYIDDEELMTFERSEARRRNEIQEQVEKRASNSHENHQWG
tara:strand:+ start:1214 stop:1735 length:522 start_codon:yes stop_codon:yes gene_type:complete